MRAHAGAGAGLFKELQSVEQQLGPIFRAKTVSLAKTSRPAKDAMFGGAAA